MAGSKLKLKSITIIIPFIGLIFFSLYHFNFMLDDPYISFRYARNFIEGNGLVFNPSEKVEGYSNFLWIMLLVPFMKAGLDPVVVSKVMGLIFAFLSIYYVYKLSLLIFHSQEGKHWIGMLAVSLLGFSWYYSLWSIGGLETTFFSFLILVSVYFLVRYHFQGDTRFDWSCISLALASMTRPEGPLFFGLFTVIKFFLTRCKPKAIKQVLLWIIGHSVVFGTYFLWRFSYYGDIFPNTYYAKTLGGTSQYIMGLKYAVKFILSHGNFFTAMIIVSAFGIYRLILRNVGIRILVILFIGYLAFVIYSGGDWMGGFRFFVHIFPVYAILLGAGFFETVQYFASKIQISYRKTTMLAIGTGFVIILSSLWFTYDHLYKEIPWLQVWYKSLNLQPQGPYYEVSQYLNRNVPKGSVVALSEAGLIPYYAKDINIIDYFGLMDRHIARLPGLLHEKSDADYVLKRKPDYILVFANEDKAGVIRYALPPVKQLLDNKLFVENYELVYKTIRSSGELDDYFYLYKLAKDHNTGGTISSKYDLYDHFEDAALVGKISRDDNPWKSSIAKITISDDQNSLGLQNSERGIFSLPDTVLSYRLSIPTGRNAVFKVSLGIHPLARTWGSDGARMKVIVVSGTRSDIVLNNYIKPEMGMVTANVSLTKYEGKTISLNLLTENDSGKSQDGDWAVWLEPTVYVNH